MDHKKLRLNRRTLARASAGGAALLAAGPAWSRRAHAQGGEVSFMTWDQIADTPMETAINAFQESSGTVVNVQPTPGSGSDYETKMRTLLASGAPPDVMRINDDFVRGFFNFKFIEQNFFAGDLSGRHRLIVSAQEESSRTITNRRPIPL